MIYCTSQSGRTMGDTAVLTHPHITSSLQYRDTPHYLPTPCPDQSCIVSTHSCTAVEVWGWAALLTTMNVLSDIPTVCWGSGKKWGGAGVKVCITILFCVFLCFVFPVFCSPSRMIPAVCCPELCVLTSLPPAVSFNLHVVSSSHRALCPICIKESLRGRC